MFISPDTVIPDPTHVYDYNRYAYGRLNPLKYNDPTGHCSLAAAGSPVMLADMGFCEGDSPNVDVGGGGGAVFIAGGVTAVAAGYLIGQAAHDLVQDLGSYLTPDTGPVGADVLAEPLPVNSSSSTSFPLADDGPETSIPPSTGVFNNTLNVLADPLPEADPAGHIYFADRANSTSEIVGREGTYTISYDSHGYPDFTPYAIAQVKISMKGNYTSDFTDANKAAGYKKTPTGYTWHHHQDGETMQLVPTDLHKRVFHYGGVNTVKNK